MKRKSRLRPIDMVWTQCVGPAIQPRVEPCISPLSDKGWFKIPKTGDGAPYNGIRNWRCSTCFPEHRKRIHESD